MTEESSSSTSEGRALLTEREREALAGEKSDSYRYKTRSYFRNRLEKLEHDVELLAEHDPELLQELRTVVDGNSGGGEQRGGIDLTGGEASDSDPTPTLEPETGVDISAVVAELEIQGAGSKEDGQRAALIAILEHLREHEEASTGELKDIAEEYPHGFEGGADSFWSNTWRGDAFPQLEEAGVVESGGSADEYYWGAVKSE
jgi:hypothetical protein